MSDRPEFFWGPAPKKIARKPRRRRTVDYSRATEQPPRRSALFHDTPQEGPEQEVRRLGDAPIRRYLLTCQHIYVTRIEGDWKWCDKCQKDVRVVKELDPPLQAGQKVPLPIEPPF